MIYFNEVLVKKAYELLKSVSDLQEAKKDVTTIDQILYNYDNHLPLDYDYLIKYEHELCNKYETIKLIDELSKRVRWKEQSGYINEGNYPPCISNLKNYKFCILAHALKSTGEIVEYIEFFDKSKIL